MLYYFARAYQRENLNHNQQDLARKKRLGRFTSSNAALLDHLGDLLIALGGRIKQHNSCPELTHGQA